MRPVGAPQDPVGELLDDAAGEGHDVAVCRPLAVERGWAAAREALRAGDLAPRVGLGSQEVEEGLELGAVWILRDVGATHVVDDEGQRDADEEVAQVDEVGGLEVDDDVPAERGDPLDDPHEVLARSGVDEPLDEVEAHPAHPGLVQLGELAVGHVGPHGGDAARHPAGGAKGVDHRAGCRCRDRSPGRRRSGRSRGGRAARRAAPSTRRTVCTSAPVRRGTRRPARRRGSARRRHPRGGGSAARWGRRTSPATRGSSRTSGASSVLVAQAERGQWLAHRVHVEAELAGPEADPFALLGGLAASPTPRRLRRLARGGPRRRRRCPRRRRHPGGPGHSHRRRGR